MNIPPTQALIAAGGYGTRMRLASSVGSKSLLKFNNKHLLTLLLESLHEAGIKDLVIATHTHTENSIKRLVESGPPFQKLVYIKSENGFRRIPNDVINHLDNRFLFICGHHALPTQHISDMLIASGVNRYVLSGYRNELFKYIRDRRVVFEKPTLKLVNSRFLEKDHIYIKNPFIIDHTVVKSSCRNNFEYPFSYYVLQECLVKNDFKVVISEFPPEFDTETEFDFTKALLKSGAD